MGYNVLTLKKGVLKNERAADNKYKKSDLYNG